MTEEKNTPTSKLRSYMKALESIRSEHNRQRNCPSRGYNEDEAFSEMIRLEDAIEQEMDNIDLLVVK